MPAAPSTDWKEIIAPDEAARFEGYAAVIAQIQQRFTRNDQVPRTLHNKPHVGARAQLIVRADLPVEFRVGIFATARTYDACVRYSNGGPKRANDHRRDVRGLAVKLLGVDGMKVIPGMESARTQDFLFIDAASFLFRTADDFIFFANAGLSPATLVPRMIGRFGFFGAISLLRKLAASVSKPVVSMATLRLWTAVPTRFGAYAAKFSLTPIASTVAVGPTKGENPLRGDLIARLQAGPVRYQLGAQLFRDETTTPIEDPTIEWREEIAPFVPIAELVVLQQDLLSEEGAKLEARIETLSFDPWHACEEFRPLGEIMRARSAAYRVSTIGRKAAPEPEGALDV